MDDQTLAAEVLAAAGAAAREEGATSSGSKDDALVATPSAPAEVIAYHEEEDHAAAFVSGGPAEEDPVSEESRPVVPSPSTPIPAASPEAQAGEEEEATPDATETAPDVAEPGPDPDEASPAEAPEAPPDEAVPFTPAPLPAPPSEVAEASSMDDAFGVAAGPPAAGPPVVAQAEAADAEADAPAAASGAAEAPASEADSETPVSASPSEAAGDDETGDAEGATADEPTPVESTPDPTPEPAAAAEDDDAPSAAARRKPGEARGGPMRAAFGRVAGGIKRATTSEQSRTVARTVPDQPERRRKNMRTAASRGQRKAGTAAFGSMGGSGPQKWRHSLRDVSELDRNVAARDQQLPQGEDVEGLPTDGAAARAPPTNPARRGGASLAKRDATTEDGAAAETALDIPPPVHAPVEPVTEAAAPTSPARRSVAAAEAAASRGAGPAGGPGFRGAGRRGGHALIPETARPPVRAGEWQRKGLAEPALRGTSQPLSWRLTGAPRVTERTTDALPASLPWHAPGVLHHPRVQRLPPGPLRSWLVPRIESLSGTLPRMPMLGDPVPVVGGALAQGLLVLAEEVHGHRPLEADHCLTLALLAMGSDPWLAHDWAMRARNDVEGDAGLRQAAANVAGVASARAGEIDRALILFKAAEEGPHRGPAGMWNRARLLALSNQPDRAIELYDQLLTRFEDEPSILLDRARTKELQGDLTAAEEGYRSVLEQAPAHEAAADALVRVEALSALAEGAA